MEKYHGEFADLQGLVSKLNYSGQWADENGKKIFRSNNGAVLNWWPSTGTIQFQGPPDVSNKLENAISSLVKLADIVSAVSTSSDANPSPPDSSSTAESILPSTSVASRRVFVVYGHDVDAREQLRLVLHILNLEPFVLGNTSGGGQTIIEALETEIFSQAAGNCLGIVLLTPDDMGYEQGSDPKNAEPRARQNVVLEMGMLIAAFGRQRVAILRKGDVVVPSDASGIIHIPFNSHVRDTVPKLCKRLREAGYELSADSVIAALA